MLPQLANRLGFLLRSFPEKAIDSGGPFARVFRHALDSHRFGRKRVGQQMLESFHLPPSAGLHRLHDTRLEPTHGAVERGPVKGIPLHLSVGDCTSSYDCCHLLCLPDRLAKFSREERPEGSQPAFAWGDVAGAQPLSVPLQDSLRLFPPPVPALRWARLTARFPLGAPDGLTTFRIHA